jgi:methanogenic corrinoid protein MtbC1
MQDERVSRLCRALASMEGDEARRMLTDPTGALLPFGEVEALIVPALELIGKDWEEGRIALSQVYMSGRQCEAIMEDLATGPDGAARSGPRIAIAVLEDYHLLGMRLVSSVLRASGFSLIIYGRMELEALASRAAADGVEILLISVLMLRSALRVRELRRRLDSSGRGPALAVGGAPFRLDKELWREVGADGTADTASGAVALVRRLAEGRTR